MQEQKKTPGTSARTQTRKRDYRKELSSGSPAATEASAHGCLHRVAIDGAYHHLRRQASKAHTESMHPGLRASGVHLLEPGLLVRSDHSLQRPERHQNTNRGYKRTGTTPAHVTVSLPCPVRGMPSSEPCGSLSISGRTDAESCRPEFLNGQQVWFGTPKSHKPFRNLWGCGQKTPEPTAHQCQVLFPSPFPPWLPAIHGPFKSEAKICQQPFVVRIDPLAPRHLHSCNAALPRQADARGPRTTPGHVSEHRTLVGYKYDTCLYVCGRTSVCMHSSGSDSAKAVSADGQSIRLRCVAKNAHHGLATPRSTQTRTTQSLSQRPRRTWKFESMWLVRFVYLDPQSGTFTGSGAGIPTPAFFWIWSGAFSKSLHVDSQGFAFFVV